MCYQFLLQDIFCLAMGTALMIRALDIRVGDTLMFYL